MRPPRKVENDIPKILPDLRNFIASPETTAVNRAQLCKTAPINFDDPLLELLPEAYIDSKPVKVADIENAAENLVRETASFLIRFKKEALMEKLNAID